jgi:hypothetical protein
MIMLFLVFECLRVLYRVFMLIGYELRFWTSFLGLEDKLRSNICYYASQNFEAWYRGWFPLLVVVVPTPVCYDVIFYSNK